MGGWRYDRGRRYRARRAAVAGAAFCAGVALAGCGPRFGAPPEGTPPEWRQVAFAGGFAVSLPPWLERADARGIDTEVALYRGDGLELLFDYGPYGGTPNEPAWTTEGVTLNGRRGTLAGGRWGEPGEYPYGLVLYLPETRREEPRHLRSLTITALCATDELCDVARRILGTLRIRD
jgi:hypothetical protein